jgi:hypothetical protein
MMINSDSNWLAFTETAIFTKQLHALTTIDTLFALQKDLLQNPTRGNVIKGTNGARKGRIGDAAKNVGKSSSYRYIYVYLEKADKFYLLLFYGKSKQETLSPAEAKQIGELVSQLKKLYDE